MEELEGIMQNVQDVIDNGEDQSESQQSPDPYKGKASNLEESSPDVGQPSNKRKAKLMNIDELDQDSLYCMLELMMILMEADQTAEEFFDSVIFQQEVKKGDKKKTLKIMKSSDFFDIMR